MFELHIKVFWSYLNQFLTVFYDSGTENQVNMCLCKVQYVMGQKTSCNQSRSVFLVFQFSRNLTTGNQKISEFVQLQPVVRSFAVGFSSVSVNFLVQWTGPANITCTSFFSVRDAIKQDGVDS